MMCLSLSLSKLRICVHNEGSKIVYSMGNVKHIRFAIII